MCLKLWGEEKVQLWIMYTTTYTFTSCMSSTAGLVFLFIPFMPSKQIKTMSFFFRNTIYYLSSSIRSTSSIWASIFRKVAFPMSQKDLTSLPKCTIGPNYLIEWRSTSATHGSTSGKYNHNINTSSFILLLLHYPFHMPIILKTSSCHHLLCFCSS